jgi:hypothetical protein
MGFKSGPVEIGTSDTDVFEMGVGLQGACVLGIGNVNGSARTITVKFYRQQTALTTTLTTGYSIAANTFVKFPIPLSMQAGDKIIMSASNASSITATPTVTDSAAALASLGFTPRGEWSGAITYARNDLVRIAAEGTTYVSMIDDNLMIEPNGTDPGAWMVFVEDGDQGDPGADGVFSAVASQAEAEAGTDNTKGMTPLRVAQARNFASLTAAPTADLTASGDRTTLTAGENLVFGDLVYIKSDGKMWKTDADAAATMPAVFMALATILADAAGLFLLPRSFVRNDAWAWTVGGAIYASTTPGAMTQTQPSGTDDVIQVVGFATHADRMFFMPSPDYITHT